MFGNMFDSIYGETDQGIFDILYSRHGASPPVKPMDIRLGDYGQEEEDDDDDDEEEAAGALPAAAPVSNFPTYIPTTARSTPFFAQDIGGFPLWLVGVGFLGFAWAYRRKRKKQSSRRK